MMNKNDNETGMRPQPMPSNDNTSTIIAPTAAGDVDNEGIDGILVGGMRDDGRSGLFRQARAVVFELGGGIIGSPGMQTEKRFVQHGITTTYEHSVDVATVAVMLALYAGFDGDGDLGNLVKSGLLHDYFLYDWHDNAPWHRLHGFTHGRTASLNALRDFGEKAINPVVVDSLCRHMFPLTASRPSYAEGWLVCIADKICASRETFTRRRFGKDEWLARHARFMSTLPCVPSCAKPALQAVADGFAGEHPLDAHVVRLNAYRMLADCRDMKMEWAGRMFGADDTGEAAPSGR